MEGMSHISIKYIVENWTNTLMIKSSCRGIILQDHLILYCSKLEVNSVTENRSSLCRAVAQGLYIYRLLHLN